MNNQHLKEKKHFQIERIAFFSDAVLAIAATLLIIEIKAPHIEKDADFTQQLHQLKHLLPEFISFIISFVMIYSEWTKHHKLFGNLIDYDDKLVQHNSLFLLSTAIIPFSTSYFALNNSGEHSLPYLVYGLSLLLFTLSNYRIFKHVTSEKNNLFDKSIDKPYLKIINMEYLLIPTTIISGILISFINFQVGIILTVIIFTIGHFIVRNKKKEKHPLKKVLEKRGRSAKLSICTSINICGLLNICAFNSPSSPSPKPLAAILTDRANNSCVIAFFFNT